MKNSLLLVALTSLLFIACEKNKDEEFEVAKETYVLPGNTFFPEGIAYDRFSGRFYTGSVTNGDILRVDVTSGETTMFATGAAHNRNAATGMKIDGMSRLWVCGGADNKIQVVDLDGRLVKSWDTKALFGSGFINDCATDNTYIYFTDSQVRKIYRANITEANPTTLEEWLTFTDAQITYATGTNANGIVSTPDNKYLIIVISSSGKLFRIDKSTKAISEIILNTPVTSGDGLYIEGNILYVSRNAINQIFPVTLNADITQGTVGTGFGTNLLFNTTLAKAGDYFLVVNGQLNRRGNATTPPSPVLPFAVSRVAIP